MFHRQFASLSHSYLGCLGICACLMFSGVGAAQQTAKQTTKKPTITINKVETKEYGFVAAGGWVALKNSAGNSALAGPALKGKLNPSFVIEARKLPKEVTPSLGKVRDVQMSEFPKLIDQFKLISEKTVKIAPHKTLALHWNYIGKKDKQVFQWTQVLAIRNQKLYTLTLTLPEGTTREVAAAGQQMLKSFYFKN